MDRPRILRAFDGQVRQGCERLAPGELVERDTRVLRRIPRAGGWTGVCWCRLDAHSADGAIAAEVNRFSPLAREWEWKHYSYDTPPNLPERLLAHGFSADPAEALLFAPAGDVPPEPPLPGGVELVAVQDAVAVEWMARVHDEVFSGENTGLDEAILSALARRPPSAAALVALADGEPVGCGRIEFYADSEFAGLWGDATVTAWRKRGIFRAIVARCAALARARGVRYLQADAAAMSQPTFERLGFVELATTTPYRHPPGRPA